MPQLPEFLAGALERVFGHPCTIADTTELAPGLQRLILEGSTLVNAQFVPGQEVELRVGGGAFRHYTPARWNAQGAFELIIHLHGQGPGSAWATSARRGDSVVVLGPGGPTRLRDGDWQLWLGDPTALGLFVALAAKWAKPIFGGIACNNGSYPKAVGVNLPVLYPDGLMDAAASVPLPKGRGQAVLAGRGDHVALARKILIQRGFPSRDIQTRAFWTPGRAGL